MYYIEETDDELIKYEVEINEENLIELREKIINNCSNIIHHRYQYESELDFNMPKGIYFKNYHSRKIEEPKDYFETYVIEYDEYMPTPLVNYIDYLLNGYAQIISLLKDYSLSCNPILLVKQREIELKATLRRCLTEPLEKIEIQALKESINSLEALKEERELNKNQVNDKIYYDDVMKCITLTEVDRMDKDTIRRVEEFQGTSYTKKNK
ncbi:MAG TPA: hypothetical protein IAB38_06540 [Candidatus Onthousia excrementipullorum]|uniref:Uncharacterized protein n=1 Tax=Candidatus Onthousia excrementipullorum TaxID=2840884 RepID=A0A9D1J3L7_9FIRM|nr:hypothetical protein [Candidatus Onthousia excrementipullorum]